MGGRGSGGGRSGGGGGNTRNSQELLPNKTINKYSIDNRGFIKDIQDKLKPMSDLQLDQQFKNTEREIKKASKQLKQEQSKLNKINKEFNKITQGSKEYHQKMKEMNEQIKNVQIAKEWVAIREQTHFIVVNEKFNIRGKK